MRSRPERTQPMSDDALKSAYELAMERLKAKDRERGIAEEPLTADQKRRIGEIRTQAKAKLAELEILTQSERRRLHDPEALAKAEQEYVAERSRVEERAESAIAKIRREPS